MTITVTREGEVATIVLDRPDKLNALTDEMFSDLARAVEALHAEGSRAVVLTGSGRAFCAGLDLDLADALPKLPVTEFYAYQRRWGAAVASLRMTPIPVIAAVNGAAAGAGFSIALAADIRLASPNARFNAAFVRIGLSGGDCGSSWLLPRVVGLGHAAELLYTGRVVGAEEAQAIGLVNRVVDADKLLEEAKAVAAAIAANSPFGVTLTKELLQANVDAPSLGAAIELENRSQVLAAQTTDMIEAVTAFRQKRSPMFTGR